MEAALDKATGEPLMVVTYFGEPDLTIPVLTPTPTITPQPRFASMDDANRGAAPALAANRRILPLAMSERTTFALAAP